MSACASYQELLDRQLAGELSTEEAARLEQHLASCPGCRDEAQQLASLLGLARLPQVSEAEARALEGLPARTWEVQRASPLPRAAPARWAAGLAAAAAAALLFAHRGPPLAPAPVSGATPSGAAPPAELASAAPAQADAEEAGDAEDFVPETDLDLGDLAAADTSAGADDASDFDFTPQGETL